jgi:filamentous hemagglutinin family protein
MSVGSGYRNQSIPANSLIVEGNVGIGTANPQAKLDVNGNVVLGGQYNEVIVKDANLIVEGPIQVDGEASIHDTLFVTNTNGVLVGGDLSVNKNLLIGYDATILGALKVDAKDATGGLGLAYDPVYRSTQASNIPYSCNADHRGEIRVIYDPGSQKRDALCWCGWRNRNNDEYGWSCILTN